jgi:hypothetical protein
MVALYGVAAASPVSTARSRRANEAHPCTVCFERAVLGVQLHVVAAQLDGELEALDETFRAAKSVERPADELMMKMQAQMEELEKTKRHARALAESALQVGLEADPLGCDLFELPRIS